MTLNLHPLPAPTTLVCKGEEALGKVTLGEEPLGEVPLGKELRRKALRTTAALALLATAGAAHALSLAEAYTAALGNDPQFRAAQAQTEASREALPQAVARLRPNISISSQHYRI